MRALYFNAEAGAIIRSGRRVRGIVTCASVQAVMRIKVFSQSTLRTRLGAVALAVMAGVSALSTAPCFAGDTGRPAVVEAPPSPSPLKSIKQAPIPNQADVSPSRPTYEITSFSLLGVRPDPVIVGSSATADFVIEAQSTDPSRTRTALADMVNRLRVAIDIGSLVEGAASARFDFLDDGDRVKLSGTAIFSLNTDIRSSFFGVNWGSSHPVYLVDPLSGAKSSPVTVTVRSPVIAQVGLLSGGTALIGLLGYAAFLFTGAMRRSTAAQQPREYLPQPAAVAADEELRPVLLLPDVPPALIAALSEGPEPTRSSSSCRRWVPTWKFAIWNGDEAYTAMQRLGFEMIRQRAAAGGIPITFPLQEI
jgi:hypothetical protein